MSDSLSDSCCIETMCNCESWLTAFCDYEPLTIEYCDETTEFVYGRSSGVSLSDVSPQAGIHQADKVFRVSMLENSIDIGLGATITDSEGTVWVVYSVKTLNHYCVKVMNARSVAACFQLLENIDVLELEAQTGDCCADEIKYRRLARVKGKVTAETGTLSTRNDSKDLVYNFSGSLERWPLSVRPSASHRLKTKTGSYRITRVRDGGPFVPYYVELEQESVDCSVRG